MKKREVNQTLRAFVDRLMRAEISEATIVTIICLVADVTDRTATAEKLLEATKDCETDEEFLAAVRAVLGEED